MSSFFNSSILKSIRQELIRRQEKALDISINRMNRVAYARLDSNAINRNNKSITLAIENVLETIKGGEDVYYKDSDLGRRPVPYITNVNVDTVSEFGAGRIATIDFICFTPDQLKVYTQLYMNIGVRCRLQFGFDETFEYNTPIYDSLKHYSSRGWFVNLYSNHSGKVDVVTGPVCNFNWKLNQDGSFSCQTKIITAGQLGYNLNLGNETSMEASKSVSRVMFSLDPTILVKSIKTESSEDGVSLTDEENNKNMDLLAKYNDTIKSIDYYNNILFPKSTDQSNSFKNASFNISWAAYNLTHGNTKFAATGVNKTSVTVGKQTIKYHRFLSIKSTPEVNFNKNINYISLGHFFDCLNFCMAYNYADSGNSNLRQMYQHLYSTNSNLLQYLRYTASGTKSQVIIDCLNEFNNPNRYVRSFYPENVLFINSELERGFDSKKIENIIESVDTTYLYTKNMISTIYVNLESVIDIINNNSTVVRIIDSVLSLVNSSTGNFINLIRYESPIQNGIISIIDQSLEVNIRTNESEFKFELYNTKSIIREIDYSSTLPNEMQSAAYFSSLNNSVYSNRELDVTFDSFYGGYVDKTEHPKQLTSDDKYLNIDKSTREDCDSILNGGISILDLNVSVYVDSYVYIISRLYKHADSVVGIPIGLTLTITLDGISGILPGNEFGINYGLDFISGEATFFVTKVSHSVNPNHGWVTKINGMLRSVTKRKRTANISLKEVKRDTKESNGKAESRVYSKNNIPSDTGIPNSYVYNSNSKNGISSNVPATQTPQTPQTPQPPSTSKTVDRTIKHTPDTKKKIENKIKDIGSSEKNKNTPKSDTKPQPEKEKNKFIDHIIIWCIVRITSKLFLGIPGLSRDVGNTDIQFFNRLVPRIRQENLGVTNSVSVGTGQYGIKITDIDATVTLQYINDPNSKLSKIISQFSYEDNEGAKHAGAYYSIIAKNSKGEVVARYDE